MRQRSKLKRKPRKRSSKAKRKSSVWTVFRDYCLENDNKEKLQAITLQWPPVELQLVFQSQILGQIWICLDPDDRIKIFGSAFARGCLN